MPTLTGYTSGEVSARVTNSTDATFPSRIPTTTAPTSNDGVVSLPRDPTWVSLIPYGVGATNTTFDVRVIGWRKYGAINSTTGTLYTPRILLQFTATLGTAAGVAGSNVDETNLFADTLSDPVTGMGAIGVNCQPTSPANDTVAHYYMDAQGCQFIEVLFDMTGASSGNCLVGVM